MLVISGLILITAAFFIGPIADGVLSFGFTTMDDMDDVWRDDDGDGYRDTIGDWGNNSCGSGKLGDGTNGSCTLRIVDRIADVKENPVDNLDSADDQIVFLGRGDGNRAECNAGYGKECHSFTTGNDSVANLTIGDIIIVTFQTKLVNLSEVRALEAGEQDRMIQIMEVRLPDGEIKQQDTKTTQLVTYAIGGLALVLGIVLDMGSGSKEKKDKAKKAEDAQFDKMAAQMVGAQGGEGAEAFRPADSQQCSRCGGPLTFVDEYQRWYCTECQAYD